MLSCATLCSIPHHTYWTEGWPGLGVPLNTFAFLLSVLHSQKFFKKHHSSQNLFFIIVLIMLTFKTIKSMTYISNRQLNKFIIRRMHIQVK